jgi:hypothetical protein
MNYTRGKAGPVSRMRIEVSTVEITEAGANSRASGGGVATMAGGRLKAVEFNIQGKHVDAARPSLVPGGVLDVDVRWTGGTAITVKKVHGAETGTPAAPVAAARRAGLDAQVRAAFR